MFLALYDVQRCISQRLTTLNQCYIFQRRFSQHWTTMKQCCEYDQLKNSRVKNKSIILSFK